MRIRRTEYTDCKKDGAMKSGTRDSAQPDSILQPVRVRGHGATSRYGPVCWRLNHSRPLIHLTGPFPPCSSLQGETRYVVKHCLSTAAHLEILPAGMGGACDQEMGVYLFATCPSHSGSQWHGESGGKHLFHPAVHIGAWNPLFGVLVVVEGQDSEPPLEEVHK